MGLIIKRNDNYPPIEATLKDAAGVALNLANATVKLIVKKTGKSTVLLNKTMTIVSAPEGKVSYSWASGETASEGLYEFEFEINYQDGSKLTVPNDSYEELRIIEDIA